jgi:trans-aconitate methyltransferase
MAVTWKEVWEARRVDPACGSVLAQLVAADGFDQPFGRFSDEAWREYVRRTAAAIGIVPGSSVFDVGCGAGAYLFELCRQGCAVGGLDASPALIRHAGEAMPAGNWIHADAAELDAGVPYDFVIANASFHYFPSYEYAGVVLERMVRKARRGVMLLDVPDLARRDQAIELRRRLAGEETYARKYDGLEHLYFDRHWFPAVLEGLGAERVWIEDQQIEGYANSAHRYNVFARLTSQGSANA